MFTKISLDGFDINETTGSLDSVRGRRVSNISVESLSQEELYGFLASIAVDTLAKAKQLVPVDTGRLRDSGYVVDEGWTYVIGFNTPYAGYVHESITNRHLAPTQCKYLIDAFVQVMQSLVINYGASSIPDFDVRVEMDTNIGVRLVIMYDKKTINQRGYTWRRVVGA